jgi:uncharacterized protein (TIGR02145 family)
VTVSVTADGGPDPATLSTDYGIVGETCLDVKKTGQEKTDIFADRKDGFPDDNFTKTYKFVHGNNYSDLVLSLDDPDHLVADITPPLASVTTGIGGEQPFTVTFDPDVKNKVSDNGDSLTVRLYASYKENNDESKYAWLEIRVEDGTCICPAKTGSNTWLNFMCHNLGALDIISPSQLITYEHHGDWYRFGAKNYSLKNEGTNNDIVDDWISSSNANYPFYTGSGDWPVDEISGNGLANPCPAGWRLPTNSEWTAVINNNNNTSWISGGNVLRKLGDELILPGAGLRGYTNGRLTTRGYGYYWSSTGRDSSDGWIMNFEAGQPATSYARHGGGLSVRCVESE